MARKIPARSHQAARVPPALPQGFVHRHRLDDVLDRCRPGALTLVSAPAGTGKTAAVASWASRLPGDGGRHFWLTVDNQVPDIAGLLDTLPVPAPGTTVVLDCDRPLRPEEADAVDALVRDEGEDLRLVLLSRSDPLLPLQRYRLADSLVELRVDDLAFTPDETMDLLHGRGVDLPTDAVELLTRRTRGWIAGLLLTAMALPHARDPLAAIEALAGDRGPVAEYLLTEMLDKQPPGLREVLLRCSVLDVLCAEVVNDVLGNSMGIRTLSFLAHNNVLIEPCLDEPGCYAYHPLFADLLRAQLAFESPTTFEELHRRAAVSMAAHGRASEALKHYVSVGAWDEATRCLIDDLAVAEVVDGATLAGAVIGLTTGLPEDLQTAGGQLVRAALALRAGDAATSGVALRRARALLARDPAGPWPAGDMTLHFLRALHARAIGDPQTVLAEVAEAEDLLAMLNPGTVRARPALAATLRNARALALAAHGHLRAAADSFGYAASTMEASAHSAEPGRPAAPPDQLVESLGHLALIAAWRGNLRKAVALAQRALAIRVPPSASGQVASITGRRAAQTALDWSAVERQLAPTANPLVEPVAEHHRWVRTDPLQAVMARIASARRRRMSRDFNGAQEALRALEGSEAVPEWLGDTLLAELANHELIVDRTDEALNVIRRLKQPPALETAIVVDKASLARGVPPKEVGAASIEPAGPTASRVDFWLLETWRRIRNGQEGPALRALDRSLRLAAPDRLRRPFLEAPAEVRQLLRTDQVAPRAQWLRTDATSAAPPVPRQRRNANERPDSSEPVEQLTTKELEVLCHLEALLTTEEIADAMFISVNTVRTHVRNILRKLSAARRNEAVRRARKLGLLPPSGGGTPPAAQPEPPAP
jgi:LuxR family maltose regulon positive regulatory protein